MKIQHIGFIGGGEGSVVGRAHFTASQMDGRFKVVAGFFGLNELDRNKTAQTWHIPADRSYNDLGSFIEGEKNRLDAVVVLTPTPTHAEFVNKLLDSGFNVICEKALACSSDEIFDIESALARNEGSFLCVTYNYTGYPAIRKIAKMITDGELGKLLHANFDMPQETFVKCQPGNSKPASPQNWRLRDGRVPTIILDLGVHVHHLCLFCLSDEPKEVMAHYDQSTHFPTVTGDAHLWLKTKKEVFCSIQMSKTSLGHRNGLKVEIYGDKGAVSWFQQNPDSIKFTDQWGCQKIIDRGMYDEIMDDSAYNRFKAGHPTGFIEAYGNFYSDIAVSLQQQERNKFVPGIEEARAGIELFEAANRSVSSKTWVTVNSQID